MTKKVYRKFLPRKVELFWKFENVAWKIGIFLTLIHDPQIPNQNDAAEYTDASVTFSQPTQPTYKELENLGSFCSDWNPDPLQPRPSVACSYTYWFLGFLCSDLAPCNCIYLQALSVLFSSSSVEELPFYILTSVRLHVYTIKGVNLVIESVLISYSCALYSMMNDTGAQNLSLVVLASFQSIIFYTLLINNYFLQNQTIFFLTEVILV